MVHAARGRAYSTSLPATQAGPCWTSRTGLTTPTWRATRPACLNRCAPWAPRCAAMPTAWRGFCLPWREHRIEGAVLTFIDITDRRKAGEIKRVRLGEAHLKLMTESARLRHPDAGPRWRDHQLEHRRRDRVWLYPRQKRSASRSPSSSPTPTSRRAGAAGTWNAPGSATPRRALASRRRTAA